MTDELVSEAAAEARRLLRRCPMLPGAQQVAFDVATGIMLVASGSEINRGPLENLIREARERFPA